MGGCGGQISTSPWSFDFKKKKKIVSSRTVKAPGCGLLWTQSLLAQHLAAQSPAAPWPIAGMTYSHDHGAKGCLGRDLSSSHCQGRHVVRGPFCMAPGPSPKDPPELRKPWGDSGGTTRPQPHNPLKETQQGKVKSTNEISEGNRVGEDAL